MFVLFCQGGHNYVQCFFVCFFNQILCLFFSLNWVYIVRFFVHFLGGYFAVFLVINCNFSNCFKVAYFYSNLTLKLAAQ